mgnify:CR=1 FL=1
MLDLLQKQPRRAVNACVIAGDELAIEVAKQFGEYLGKALGVIAAIVPLLSTGPGVPIPTPSTSSFTMDFCTIFSLMLAAIFPCARQRG